tara:strand:+ start:1423 stop:2430 length:1008 start_codon:yes stop_codon:yes gene_type:complete
MIKGRIFLFLMILLVFFPSISASQIYYYNNDHLGSPAVVTDKDQNIVYQTEYDPFGEPIREQGNSNKIKYNSKQKDDTGLYYYGARYYNPQIGRFITADTVKGKLTDTQSQNRYVYVKNNPTKYIDPTGEQAEEILGGEPVLQPEDNALINAPDYITSIGGYSPIKKAREEGGISGYIKQLPFLLGGIGLFFTSGAVGKGKSLFSKLFYRGKPLNPSPKELRRAIGLAKTTPSTAMRNRELSKLATSALNKKTIAENFGFAGRRYTNQITDKVGTKVHGKIRALDPRGNIRDEIDISMDAYFKLTKGGVLNMNKLRRNLRNYPKIAEFVYTYATP